MPAQKTQSVEGTLTANGHTVELTQRLRPAPLVAWVTIDAPAGTSFVFEASADDSTWTAVRADRVEAGPQLDPGTITPTKITSQTWVIRTVFGRSLRVRCTAFSSGTANVRIDFPLIPHEQFLAAKGIGSGLINRFLPGGLGSPGVVGVPGIPLA